MPKFSPKVVIDKKLLRFFVGKIPQTAVQLHEAYMHRVEPFAALDQIEAALRMLVADQEVLSSVREDNVRIYYRDTPE